MSLWAVAAALVQIAAAVLAPAVALSGGPLAVVVALDGVAIAVAPWAWAFWSQFFDGLLS